MAPDKRAFYEYNSCLMEPWDGPASIAFTDGTCIGAVLDRNGLRPSRYYVTDDDRCIMASEVGVLPVAPERVVEKGRLRPGRLFLIDFDAGAHGARPRDQGRVGAAAPLWRMAWAPASRTRRRSRRRARAVRGLDEDTLLARMQAFGYTTETMQFMLLDLVRERARPARLHGQRRGARGALRQAAHALRLFQAALRAGHQPGHRLDPRRSDHVARVLHRARGEPAGGDRAPRAPAARAPSHPVQRGTRRPGAHRRTRLARANPGHHVPEGIRRGGAARGAGADFSARRRAAIDEGYSLLVFSDRMSTGSGRVPISALLATGCVHHHLVRTHIRTRIGLIVETGEAREVHHHCLLIGYGADAINPYLAFEALWYSRRIGPVRRLRARAGPTPTWWPPTARASPRAS